MTPPNRFAQIAILTSIIFLLSANVAAQKLTPHHISLANGKSFDLNLPEGYQINVAAQGLKRVRFMALSPDNRLFVTDMYNLSDNRRGVVYILDQFDTKTRQFKKLTKYMTGLHNPNNVAFYKDADGTDWFYLALTDRLSAIAMKQAKTLLQVSRRCWRHFQLTGFHTNMAAGI